MMRRCVILIGVIFLNGLGTVMRSLGQKLTDTELQDIFHEMDRNDDDRIIFQEFITSRTVNDIGRARDLEEYFQTIDEDSSLFITFDEFEESIASLSQHMTDKEMDEMIRDHNGRINFEGYKQLLEMVKSDKRTDAFKSQRSSIPRSTWGNGTM